MQPKYNANCTDKMETRIDGGGDGSWQKKRIARWIGLDRIGLDWKNESKNGQKKNAYSVNLLCVCAMCVCVCKWNPVLMWNYEPKDSRRVKSNANCLEVIILLHELYGSDLKRSLKAYTFCSRISVWSEWFCANSTTTDSFRSVLLGFVICGLGQMLYAYDRA